MKVILAMVSSLNGKITNGSNSDIHTWTSQEDSEYFSSLKEKHDLIVMGSQTYELAKAKITLDPNTLRIVLTKNPKKYAKETVAGQLEFTSEKPDSLVRRLTDIGYEQLLLVGGGEINSLFFQAKLINKILITIEPVVFGSGKNLVSEMPFERNLKLVKMQKLNSGGTLLLTYEVI